MLSEQIKNEIRKLRSEGMSYEELSDWFGVPEITIYMICTQK